MERPQEISAPSPAPLAPVACEGRPPYRRRLGYLFGSIFLFWHTAATFLGPWPDSYLKRQFYPPFRSYLTLFFAENWWAFFAPGALFGLMTEYEIETPDGIITAPLTMALSKSDPNYFRLAAMFDRTTTSYGDYVRSYGRYLCVRHRQEHPQRIRFLTYTQKQLPMMLYLSGRRPREKDFLKPAQLDWMSCEELLRE